MGIGGGVGGVVPDEVAREEAAAGEVQVTGSPWRLVLRTFAQNRLAVFGFVLIILLLLFSFVGPLIHPTNQTSPNLALFNLRPSGSHWFGTDQNGFDELGRIMVAGRTTLEIGLVVGFVSTVLGLIYGAISGYFGGIVDTVMMRLVDVGLAIPIVFLFIFMSQIFPPDLLLLMVLLVAVSWLIPARLVRGEALTLRTREYVQAVRGMGGGSFRIILKHLIPNTIGTIVVTVILTLAVLQYLGFGLPPTTPTWGSMLSDGVGYLEDGYWWQVYPVLIFMVLTVVAFNFVGDALQDAFDVRLQEK
jgi:peptide/nickel transport system permease protein